MFVHVLFFLNAEHEVRKQHIPFLKSWYNSASVTIADLPDSEQMLKPLHQSEVNVQVIDSMPFMSLIHLGSCRNDYEFGRDSKRNQVRVLVCRVVTSLLIRNDDAPTTVKPEAQVDWDTCCFTVFVRMHCGMSNC